jgi:glutathione synthase/RimK-type ligase-like ATP-grasp enzyme
VKQVALIGPADRKELLRLAIRVEERGGQAIVLDSREDPQIVMTATSEQACGVDLTGVTGVYVADLGIRSPRALTATGEVDIEGSARALAASRRHLATWNALLTRLGDRCPVVNPPRTHDLHFLKPWEMAEYARCGIPIPATISSTDPGYIATLASESATKDWIRKGLVGGYGYTEVFDPAADPKRAQGQPLMIQERIEGDNVRVFVLGGSVIGGAEVISRSSGEIDSRRGERRVRKVTVGDETQAAAKAAAELWGMHFAAIDFMRDARSGRHVVLECNSAPFFANFEVLTGLDISGQLADFLVGRARYPDG